MPQAEESRQVAKARRKLQKHLEVIDRQFTQTGLKEAVEKMYRWLEKNSESRVNLEDKNIRRLFDGNSNSASLSPAIEEQRNSLLEQFESHDIESKTLEGRVKAQTTPQFSILPKTSSDQG